MDRVYDQVFENQKVYLDYSIWDRCHFINCDIIAEYGVFHLNSCNFKNCKLILTGRARNVALLMYIFYPDEIPLIFAEGTPRPLRDDVDESDNPM